MKGRLKKTLVRFLCLVLTFIFLGGISFGVSGSTRYFAGDAEAYYQSLLDTGFPADYATYLTELHLLHPNWSFTPLQITQENSTYTWNYIIEQETIDPELNLIHSSSTYEAYRHPLNPTLYDSGYYQASTAAVKYFMDPRNFLNETDIFQFYNLSSAAGITADEVQAVLQGTFMEDRLLENGKSFTDTFLEIGNDLSINPVYLAVKARQEQGVEGLSPVISGKCGTLLNEYYQNKTQTSDQGNSVLTPTSGYTFEQLLALDGYYNLYNIKASGNGLFTIYYNAMVRAQSGTDAMSEAWGGSPAWNTLWKSAYGGAYTIKNSFIDRYQNTIYLQKFNVDSRAADRNFWGQYMQNVTGAMTEARTLYSAFASCGVLDGPCSFLIPVYDGMPKAASPDPANGKCSYLAPATQKYAYSVFWAEPFLDISESALYTTRECYAGDFLPLRGIVSHSYGVSGVEYRWDDGEWLSLSGNDQFDTRLPIDFAENSTHILTIRATAAYDHSDSAKKSSYHVLCAVIYVNVLPTPEIEVTLQNGSNIQTVNHTLGMPFSLPVCEEQDFIGWYGSDGTFFPSGGAPIPRLNTTYTALYAKFEQLSGAALHFHSTSNHLRFYAAIEREAFELLSTLPSPAIHFFATVTDAHGTQTKAVVASEQIDIAFDTEWQILSAETPPLEGARLNEQFSMNFYALFSYSDGSVQAILPHGIYCTRSAKDIASTALSDPDAAYSADTIARLEQILSDANA